MAALNIGDKIPEFSLPDQAGNIFDIKSILGSKNLVIYFYPKDDTTGCTKEACSFRDQYEDFKDIGAEVIGISSDSVKSHKRFAQKHNLSFILLSDRGGEVRKLFGVPTYLLGLVQGRVTYIADKKGKIVHIFNSQLQATKHIDESLKALKSINT